MAVKFAKPGKGLGKRVLLYGSPGVGKTSVAMIAPGPIAFFDLEKSVGNLMRGELPIDLVEAETFGEILAALREIKAFDPYQSIVIDSLSALEIKAAQHVLATIPDDKGRRVQRIEDYGFGKGFTYLVEAFTNQLLPALQGLADAGKNIILIGHESLTDVPSPTGNEDWKKYEPSLYASKTGKAHNRGEVVAWCDAVVCYRDW